MNKFLALLDKLMTPAGIAQSLALLTAAAVVFAGVHLVRRWYLPRSEAGMGLRGALYEALVVVSPYLVGWLLVVIARAAVAASNLSTVWLSIGARLLVALMLIRLLVFGLRLSLGHSPQIRRWELRITFIIWAAVATEMLGWLDYVVNTLDAIGFSSGDSRLTLWTVVVAIVTVSTFVIASVWLARLIDRRIATIQALAPSTRIGIGKFAHAFLIGFGILLGLRFSGVDLTALTVFSGAIGLGLGFGLQAIAANFVSGFVLLMDKSIKPGDVISFSGSTGTSTTGFGWVEELRGRYVVVRDRDGVATLVPNQNLITNSVINWSYGHPKVRLRLPLRLGYQDNVELALALLLEAAVHPRILREPPAVSRLMEFADYGMEIELRFWIGDPAEGVNNVRSDVNRRIWALFREHGLTIPPAQREVRILQGDVSASLLSPHPGRRVDPASDGQD